MNQFKRAQVIMLPTENKINGSIVKDIKEESKILHIKQKDYCEHEDFVAQHLYITSDDEIKEGDLHITSDHSGFGFRKYKIIATTDTSLKTDNPNYDIGKLAYITLPQPSQQFIEKYIESYNKGEIITDVLVEYEIDNTLLITENYKHPYPYGYHKNDNPKFMNIKLSNGKIVIGYFQKFNKGEGYYRGLEVISHWMIPMIKAKGYQSSTLQDVEILSWWNEKLKINPKDNTITIRKLKDSWNREEVVELLNNFAEYCQKHDDNSYKSNKWIEENL